DRRGDRPGRRRGEADPPSPLSMCGLAGIFSLADGQPLAGREHAGAVARMSELIARRGPDDDGMWVGDQARLAFRRLSILDLSSAAHQPMVSGDGRSVIVFNGEIYNFQEL